jgi:penicillin G amidase
MRLPVRPRTLVILLASLAAVLAVAAGAIALWVRSSMAASLPLLDGSVRTPGLTAAATISRDAEGVPVIDAATRLDVARATGWVHAQDRFFQMDLLRRRGAGELAELFGKAALVLDRPARMHGFKDLARKAYLAETAAHRALIDAYTEGVNAGLRALAAKPWEYAVLRLEPRPWAPEDSLLVNYAMTLDLQDGSGRYSRQLAAVRDYLGTRALAFFAPLETPDDAALDGTVAPTAALPSASDIDLRKRDDADDGKTAWLAHPTWEDRESVGSNSFAVAGALSGGPAIVANDMHLALRVPNIWYRVRLRWPGHDECGVTLPGAPVVVAGSNGSIAWGFTNSNVATSDIITVDHGPDPELYHGPRGSGLSQFEVRHEQVAVKGDKPVTMDFRWTLWGPVVGEGADGTAQVLHWTMDDPAAANMSIIDLEDAAEVKTAVSIAHRMGIPAQNFLVGDRTGAIAWTIAGFLPRRVGTNGRLPAKWSFGDRRWEGYLADAEVPVVMTPASGVLWTANNRIVGGQALALLGDAGYDIPARARQIRDDLMALGKGPVSPRDLLAIQLDDRALFLEPWHRLLLSTLSPSVVAAKGSRAALLEAAKNWEGHASVESTSYRITRAFRLAVAHRVFDPVFQPCFDAVGDFGWTRFDYEAPLRALLSERPRHLLDPSYADWDALLVAAADDVSRALEKEGVSPAKATWGRENVATIEHPFARLLPSWLSGWLRMPRDPMPGDSHMPRVVTGDHGASERFAVAPGRESEGILHMPGGASGNPLSPYYRAGHEAWVHGDPTPFLPGAPVHTVTLTP